MARRTLSGNNITEVIHIADIHVLVGDNEKARITEYTQVFDRFYDVVSQLPSVKNGTALLIIAGDVFHTKGRVEPAGTDMLMRWVIRLIDIMPIIFICGNHDFKQQEPDTPDFIDVMTRPYRKGQYKHSLHYLKHTGHYTWGNVGFGLVSVKDTLRALNTAGIVDNLPAFPSPTEFPENVTCRIALFHGTISQSSMPSSMAAANHGYPLDWFQGYDMAVLGDNHIQQIHQYGKLAWGYPGSLIQQNFGESIFGHGYIQWDLAKKSGTLHHIPSDYGYLTVEESSGSSTGECIAYIAPKRSMPIKNAFAMANFPTKPRVRIVGASSSKERITDILKGHGISPVFITVSAKHENGFNATGTNMSDGNDNNDGLESQINELSNLNSPACWEKYIQSFDPTLNVSEWIHKPRSMLMAEDDTEIPSLIETYKKRNKDIEKSLDAYEEATKGVAAGNHSIILKHVEWNNMMCFGKNNYFDFDKINGTIALLNGNNASGKSSFLDVICIAIYGEPTMMRREYSANNMTAKIINDMKPLNDSANTKLIVSVDGKDYEITRSFATQPAKDKANTIRSLKCTVHTTGTATSKVLIAEGTTTVNAWVHKHFGTPEEILMSTILCQQDNVNFFMKKGNDQKELLEKALHMEVITAYQAVLDEAVKGHKYVLEKVQSYYHGMQHEVTASGGDAVLTKAEDIQGLKGAINARASKIADITTQCDDALLDIGNIGTAAADHKETEMQSMDALTKSLQKAEEKLNALIVHVDDMANMEALTLRQGALQSQGHHLDKKSNTLEIDPTDEHEVYTPKKLAKVQAELAQLKSKPPKSPTLSSAHMDDIETSYATWQDDQIGKWIEQPDIPKKVLADLTTKLSSASMELQTLRALGVSKPVNSHAGAKATGADLTVSLKHAIRLHKEARHQLDIHNKEAPTCARPSMTINECNQVKKEYKAWVSAQNKEWISDPDQARYEFATKSKELCALHKVSMPTMDRLDSLDRLEQQDHSEQPASLEILEHLRNSKCEPCRPVDNAEAKKEWRAKWKEWAAFVETVPANTSQELAHRKMELDAYLVPIATKEKEEIDAAARHETLATKIASLSHACNEFNPECWACRKQPTFTMLDTARTDLEIVEKQLRHLRKYLAKVKGDVADVRAELNGITNALPVRERYEARADFMDNEAKAWSRAKKEAAEESARKERLALVWWALWDAWQVKHTQLSNDVNALSLFVTEWPIWKRKYEDAKANKDNAAIWSAWEAAANDASTAESEAHWQLWTLWTKEIADHEEVERTTRAQIAEIEAFIATHERYSAQWKIVVKERTIAEAYDRWTDKVEELELALSREEWHIEWRAYLQDCDAVSAALNHLRAVGFCQEDVDRHRRILAYRTWTSARERLEALRTQQENDRADLALMELNFQNQVNQADGRETIGRVLEELQDRYQRMLDFHTVFVGAKTEGKAGFKNWVYNTQVLPLIQAEVNRFIAYVDDFELCIEVGNKALTCSLKDRGSRPPLDHASGYQRFIVGLGMRIALSRIGAVGQNVKHLFIDEGFLACDAENKKKIQDIINTMMHVGGYRSILLISHDEAIRSAAETIINVCRPDDASTSYIRMGDKREKTTKIVEEHATPTTTLTMSDTPPVPAKKRGRPSKKDLEERAAQAAESMKM